MVGRLRDLRLPRGPSRITVVLFVFAAAAGTAARAEAARRWNRAAIPAGTLAVDITGSFFLGLLSQLGSPALTVIGVGGRGACTTFTGFARDAVSLAEDDIACRSSAP